ncbi:11728_t:CDS:1, partial [Entrophospora sp. SA101]
NIERKPVTSYDEESKKRLDDQIKSMYECETHNNEWVLYMRKSQRFIKKMNKPVGEILEEGILTLDYESYYIQTNFTSYKRATFHLAEVDEQPPEKYWKRLKHQIIYETHVKKMALCWIQERSHQNILQTKSY